MIKRHRQVVLSHSDLLVKFFRALYTSPPPPGYNLYGCTILYTAISRYALWACQRFDYTDGVQLPTSPPFCEGLTYMTCRLWSGLNQNLYNIKCKLLIMKHDKLCWCLITSGIWVFSCIMLFISFYEQKNIWGMVGFFSLGFSLPLLVSRFYDWSISRKKEHGHTS